MTFNRYRSARDRRWHPKFSISPRESAPVAHAAITGNALSPAARLMAAAVPPPSRGASPSAVYLTPLANASDGAATATAGDSGSLMLSKP